MARAHSENLAWSFSPRDPRGLVSPGATGMLVAIREYLRIVADRVRPCVGGEAVADNRAAKQEGPEQKIELKEEQLRPETERVKAGEVEIKKRIVSERQTK